MRYIPQGDTVDVGDVVFTSGLGGNLPKRLVIGQVASVHKSDVEMFQEADIIPAVNLRDLESVMILLNFTRIEPDHETSAGAEGVSPRKAISHQHVHDYSPRRLGGHRAIERHFSPAFLRGQSRPGAGVSRPPVSWFWEPKTDFFLPCWAG